MNKIDFIKEKKIFGKHVRKLRKTIKSSEYINRNISQQELSDRSEYISKKTIGEIERGETNPSFETLLILAKVLEVDPKELFDFELE
ncbi:helix-turn-helix domain-containing protein [Aureibaculum luteum]|uniref:helix-turn-helix domain-containing protein n=1 Tax=Aureibaculum luteum TaxID=1548456 RepID=UPI00130085BF|nr:helix-turn-helix transcriptional regulator [Aureibaculum luteum]